MSGFYWAYLFLAYLVGGIPFGFLIAKSKGVDVRTIGSGNIGATNVGRALGTSYFLITLVLDALKGFLPTWGARAFFGLTWAIPVALVTVLGHSFSPYLKFRGGKGIATGAGAYLALTPLGLLVALLVWGIALATFRIMSVASLSGAVTVLLYVLLREPNPYLKLFTVLVVAVVFLRFKDNIRRLIRGEEPRVVFGQYRPRR